MKKFIAKSILLLLIHLSMVQVAKFLFSENWGNPLLDLKLEIYNENSEQYNHVLFGSSRVYRELIPELLDSKSAGKLSSFNMGINAMGYPECFHVVSSFLDQVEQNTVKYITIELSFINTSSEKDVNTPRKKYFLTTKEASWALCYFAKMGLWEQVGRHLNAYFNNLTGISLIQDFNKYKAVFQKNKREQKATLVAQKGFLSLDGELKLTNDRYLKRRKIKTEFDRVKKQKYQLIDIEEVLDSSIKNRLEAIIKKAKEKNIEIIILNYVYSPDVNFALEVKNDFDVEGLYRNPDYMYDLKHFNEEGAIVLSNYLAEKYAAVLYK